MPATISKTNRRTNARKKAEAQKAKKKQVRETLMAARNKPAKKPSSAKRR